MIDGAWIRTIGDNFRQLAIEDCVIVHNAQCPVKTFPNGQNNNNSHMDGSKTQYGCPYQLNILAG